ACAPRACTLHSLHHCCSYTDRARLALHSFPTRRSSDLAPDVRDPRGLPAQPVRQPVEPVGPRADDRPGDLAPDRREDHPLRGRRSEEHTSELQSRENLVCRLLLEKKKNSKTRALENGRI